jgi:DNA-binding LacI/PurR family transcriptional regulator
MACTQKELAVLAGVSRMTVSRALSGTGLIAPETRNRILQLAEKLNYQANPLAQALTGAFVRSIGIVWDMEGYSELNKPTHDLCRLALRDKFTPSLVDHLGNPDLLRQTLVEFAQRRLSGVVVHSDYTLTPHLDLNSLLKPFPAAVIVHSQDAVFDHDTIIQDRLAMAREVASYFAATGRKKPAILMVNANNNTSKIEAFLGRLRELGLPGGVDQVIDLQNQAGENEAETAWNILQERYPAGFPFDAAWCSQDAVAAKVIRWLKSQNVRVPEDVAVVGNENNELSDSFDPPIASTLREDRQVAQKAYQLLMERLKNPTLAPRREIVPMRFLWRSSAGPKCEQFI